LRTSIYKHCIKEVLLRPPHPRVVINYIKYHLNYLLKRTTLNHSPTSLVVYTTKYCNFTCDFCYTYDTLNNPEAKKFNLTNEQLTNLLNTTAGKRALRVGLLGGEPFMNKDIFQLIDTLKKHRKITTIVTNSSLLKGKLLEKLTQSKLDVLGMSLYDNNEDDVARVVKAMNQSKKMYWVQTIIMADDLDKMERTLEYAERIGCRNILMANYQPIYTGKTELTIFDDNKEYYEKVKALKEKYKNRDISISWVPVIPRKIKKKICKMPFSYVLVDSLGQLGACCFRPPGPEKFGNIFNDQDWNGNYYKKLRSNMFDNTQAPLDTCNNCENLACDLYKI